MKLAGISVQKQSTAELYFDTLSQISIGFLLEDRGEKFHAAMQILRKENPKSFYQVKQYSDYLGNRGLFQELTCSDTFFSENKTEKSLNNAISVRDSLFLRNALLQIRNVETKILDQENFETLFLKVNSLKRKLLIDLHYQMNIKRNMLLFNDFKSYRIMYYSLAIKSLNIEVAMSTKGNDGIYDEAYLGRLYQSAIYTLEKIYLSGYVDSERKNALNEEFDIIQRYLLFLSNGKCFSINETLRVLQLSRKGVMDNHLRLIENREISSELVKNLLFQLDSLEIESNQSLRECAYKRFMQVSKALIITRNSYKSILDLALKEEQGPTRLNDMLKDEASVVYFQGKHMTTQAVFYQGKLEIRHFLNQQLVETISPMLSSLSDVSGYFKGNSETYEDSKLELHRVYQYLLGNAFKKMPSQIFIYPDGLLTKIPFEALIVDKKNTPLLAHASVQYRQSIRRYTGYRLGELRVKIHRGSNDLPAALKSLDHFKSNEDKYSLEPNVLHYAMHQRTNEFNEPMLIFGNERKISLKDINKLPSSIHSIVFAACETSIGKMISGEGPRSFVRGALGSGVKNSIGSLWKVEDNATSTLLMQYYELLSDGYKSDNALTMAKRKLLASSTSFKSHPYFWASFLHYGEEITFLKNRNYNICFISLALFLLIIIGFLFRVRIKL